MVQICHSYLRYKLHLLLLLYYVLDTRKISMLKQVTEVDRLIEQVAELHWELMELQDKQTKQELVAGGATWTEALP